MPIDTKNTAVLVLDYLVGIVSDDARKAGLKKAVPVIQTARAAGLPIIYGVIAFEDDYPAIHPRNWSLTGFRGGGRYRRGTEEAEVHPDVAPQPGDVVIERRRAGIFPGTDLDWILRAKNVDTLAIMGFSTSGQVLSAVRAGVDLDYDQYVISDCCADRDEEVQRVLMTKVLTMHSKVITSEEFLKGIKG